MLFFGILFSGCSIHSRKLTGTLIDIIIVPGPVISVSYAPASEIHSIGPYTLYKKNSLNDSQEILTNQQYYALGVYSSGPTKDITTEVNWSSSNPSICSFPTEHTGILNCTMFGTVLISASMGDIMSSAPLEVTVVAPGTLDSILIEPAISNIQINETKQFIATGFYSNGSQIDITNIVTWDSDDPSVASIVSGPGGSNSGLATGVSEGSANITATFESVTSNLATVTVGQVVTGISILPNTTITIAPGGTQGYTATLTCSGGPCPGTFTPIWTSSNTACATVNPTTNSLTTTATGVNNTAAQCSTTIQAAYNAFTASATLQVSAASVTGIFISPNTTQTIAPGNTQLYTATLMCTGGFVCDNTFTPTWTSSVTTCATITPLSGSLTTTATGVNNTGSLCSTTIEAAYNAFTASATLQVSATTVTNIAITPNTTQTIAPGNTQGYTATMTCLGGFPCDNTFTPTWSSSLTTCATVTPTTGSLTTTATGVNNTASLCSTTIQAAYNAVTASVTLQVSAASVISIAISPSTTQTIAPDATQIYTAILTCTGGYTCDNTFLPTSWSSSVTTCATVSPLSGSLTTTATGINNTPTQCSTTIEVAYNAFTASVTLQVSGRVPVLNPATNVSVTGLTATLTNNATTQASGFSIVFSNISTYTCNDVSIVTAAAYGFVTNGETFLPSPITSTMPQYTCTLASSQITLTAAPPLTEGFHPWVDLFNIVIGTTTFNITVNTPAAATQLLTRGVQSAMNLGSGFTGCGARGTLLQRVYDCSKKVINYSVYVDSTSALSNSTTTNANGTSSYYTLFLNNGTQDPTLFWFLASCPTGSGGSVPQQSCHWLTPVFQNTNPAFDVGAGVPTFQYSFLVGYQQRLLYSGKLKNNTSGYNFAQSNGFVFSSTAENYAVTTANPGTTPTNSKPAFTSPSICTAASGAALQGGGTFASSDATVRNLIASASGATVTWQMPSYAMLVALTGGSPTIPTITGGCISNDNTSRPFCNIAAPIGSLDAGISAINVPGFAQSSSIGSTCSGTSNNCLEILYSSSSATATASWVYLPYNSFFVNTNTGGTVSTNGNLTRNLGSRCISFGWY